MTMPVAGPSGEGGRALRLVHRRAAITAVMPYRSLISWLGRAATVVIVLSALAAPATMPLAAPAKPEFVEIKAIVIPVIHHRELSGHFIFEIVLELEEGVQREDIMAFEPRMRDAMITDMKRYAERHPDILDRADMGRMKRVLQAAIERIAGEGLVRDVLFEHIYQRSNPYHAVSAAG